MAEQIKLRHLPTRLATGAFILNSGIGKLKSDAEAAKHLHAMASNAYPVFDSLEPETFTKLLGTAEVALGGVLILPIIPSRLAGFGLGAFSGGLIGMYLRTPGLREGGSVRPSREGTAMAKDIWMLGIALSLVMDSRVTKRSGKGGKSKD
jgi:hypothetical protein